jgi:serine/threonine protein kinase
VVQEGSTIHLHPELPGFAGPSNEKRPVTLGQHLGAGDYGSVYDVASHGLGGDKNLVVKQFHSNPKNSGLVQAEINNLRAVKKLKATGEHEGHTYAVMDKEPGVKLSETNAYKKVGFSGLESQYWDKTEAKVLHYAHPNNGGLIHSCVFCSEIPLAMLSYPNSQ